jgi:hypothetical protein
MMGNMMVGGIKVINDKAEVMPATGKTVRKRRLFCAEAEQRNIAGGEHGLMTVVADDGHTEHLTEKLPGIFKVCYCNGDVIETEICPRAFTGLGGHLTERFSLDIKGMRMKVRNCLSYEHIRKNLIPIWSADTNTVPNQ